LKSQIAVDKKTQKIICTAYTNGKRHDFRFLKESKIRFQSDIMVLTDTGYIGLQKIHAKTSIPKKRSKKIPLSAEDKRKNKDLSAQRVLNEHVIGKIKRFKIVADKYRNRRKRFGLRFNLIAGIYNYELL
jgi:hypothetical protein